MIIDCKPIFAKIMADTADLKQNTKATLAVVMPKDDPAARSYFNRLKKYGNSININVVELFYFTSHTDLSLLKLSINSWNDTQDIHGILLISEPPEWHFLRSHISPEKNVEGNDFDDDVDNVFCTARACMEIIKSQIDITGKDVTVVGYGKRVGKPLSYLLMRAHVGSVTTTHKYTNDLVRHLHKADVIVSAVGKPGFITPQMVKHDTLIIDAGIAKDPFSDKIVGDVRKDVYNVCEVTPVPGGVGPVTCAILLRNLVNNAKRTHDGKTN